MRTVIVLFTLLPGCFQEPPTDLPSGPGTTSGSSSPTSSQSSSSSTSASEESGSSGFFEASSSDGAQSTGIDTSGGPQDNSTGTTSSSSSESSGDPPDYEGLYEFCFEGNEVACIGADVTECVWSSSFGVAGYCSTTCDTAGDCPVPSTGNAQTACLDHCGVLTCALHCNNGMMCPDDMVCRPFIDFECGGTWEFVCVVPW